MQEVPLKLRYFERLSSKSLNKVNFIFSFERSWQGRQDYKKQTWPGASDQSFFRSQSKLIKIHLLAVYYLTKFEKVFELFQKIHLLIYATRFILILESKERKGKITQIWMYRKQKELFRWNKKHIS